MNVELKNQEELIQSQSIPSNKSRKVKFLLLSLFGIVLIAITAVFLFAFITNEDTNTVLVNRMLSESQNLLYLQKLRFCMAIGSDLDPQSNCTTTDSIISFHFLNKTKEDIYIYSVIVPLNIENSNEDILEQIKILKEQDLSILINSILQDNNAAEHNFILQLDSKFNIKDIFVNKPTDRSQIAMYKTIAKQFTPNLKTNLFNKKGKFLKRMLGESEEVTFEKEEIGEVKKTRDFASTDSETSIAVEYNKDDARKTTDNGVVMNGYNYDEKASFGKEDGVLLQSEVTQKGSISAEAEIQFFTTSKLILISKISSHNVKISLGSGWERIDSISSNVEMNFLDEDNKRNLQSKPYAVSEKQTYITKNVPINTQVIFCNKLETYLRIEYSNVMLTNIDQSSTFFTQFKPNIANGKLKAIQLSFLFKVDRTNLDTNEKTSYTVANFEKEFAYMNMYDINSAISNLVNKDVIKNIAGKFQNVIDKTNEWFKKLNSDVFKLDKKVLEVCVTYGAQFCFTLQASIQVTGQFGINNFADYQKNLNAWWGKFNVMNSIDKNTWINLLNTLINFNFNFQAGLKPTFSLTPAVGVYPPVKIVGLVVKGTLAVPASGSFFGLYLKFNFKTLGVKLYFAIEGSITIKLGAYMQLPKCTDSAAASIIAAVKQGFSAGGSIDNIGKEIFNKLYAKAWEIAKTLWSKCTAILKLDKASWECGMKILKGDYSCAAVQWGLSDAVALYEWTYTALTLKQAWTIYDNGKWT